MGAPVLSELHVPAKIFIRLGLGHLNDDGGISLTQLTRGRPSSGARIVVY